MDLVVRVKQHFEKWAELRRKQLDMLPVQIAFASVAFVPVIVADGKALASRNRGSAASSQHYATENCGPVRMRAAGTEAALRSSRSPEISA